MVFTLQTSGASQNSYVTRAAADAYIEQTINYAIWTVLDGATKDRYLVEAFQMLERQKYQGSRTGGDAQITQFPRDGISNCDGITQAGVSPAPTEVIRAQILLAVEILKNPDVAVSSGAGSNIKVAKAGSASVEFFASGRDAAGLKAGRFPPAVQDLLRCYLASGRGGAVGASYGTGADFECPDFGIGGNG